MCVCFFFFGVKKGPIQGSVCFKLVVGLLVLGPLSKVALIMHNIWLKVLTVIALLPNSKCIHPFIFASSFRLYLEIPLWGINSHPREGRFKVFTKPHCFPMRLYIFYGAPLLVVPCLLH
jgi:hypothetical protein